MFDKNSFRHIEDSRYICNLSNEIHRDKKNIENSDKQIRDRLKNFPPTRYYGSKRRLLGWIYENIKEFSFSTVLDAFGGTSSVSLLFKAMGKRVTYNDVLLSNTASARALLANKNPVNAEEFNNLLASISGFEGVISNNFRDIFYKDAENNWLDGAITKINTLSNNKRDVYLYCLFQACLQKRPFNLFHRANLNLRLCENQKRSFGNLATWNKNFTTHATKAFYELDLCVWNSDERHTVLESKDVCSLKNGYDLVYLDPPYLSKSSKVDNYLNKYHFLEGLVLYDKWLDYVDFNSKCLAFKHSDIIKKWHDHKRFEKLLFDLINHHRDSIVVLSYVVNSYPAIDSILKHFNQTFQQTKIYTIEVSKALSNKKSEEVLIIGLP